MGGSRALALPTHVDAAVTPGEAQERKIRLKCPPGIGGRVEGKRKFPVRLKAGGDWGNDQHWECQWPFHQLYQSIRECRFRTSKDAPVTKHNFVQPFGAKKLYRKASPRHWPEKTTRKESRR